MIKIVIKCKDFVFSGSDDQTVPKVKKKRKKRVGNGKQSVGGPEKEVSNWSKVKKHSVGVPEKEAKSQTAVPKVKKQSVGGKKGPTEGALPDWQKGFYHEFKYTYVDVPQAEQDYPGQ